MRRKLAVSSYIGNLLGDLFNIKFVIVDAS